MTHGLDVHLISVDPVILEQPRQPLFYESQYVINLALRPGQVLCREDVQGDRYDTQFVAPVQEPFYDVGPVCMTDLRSEPPAGGPPSVSVEDYSHMARYRIPLDLGRKSPLVDFVRTGNLKQRSEHMALLSKNGGPCPQTRIEHCGDAEDCGESHQDVRDEKDGGRLLGVDEKLRELVHWKIE